MANLGLTKNMGGGGGDETLLPNGDFETGDLTGWTTDSGAAMGAWAHSGTYCALINFSGTGTHYLSKTIDTTGMSHLSCWVRRATSDAYTFKIYIDGTVLYTTSADVPFDSYSKFTVDISTYVGTHTIKFEATGFQMLIDDITYTSQPIYPPGTFYYNFTMDFNNHWSSQLETIIAGNTVWFSASVAAGYPQTLVDRYIDYGDGTAPDHNVGWTAHEYDTPGTYDVTLWGKDSTGATGTMVIASAVVCNIAPPVANFTTLPVSGTMPLTVQFTDTSTGEIVSWWWDFGDGTTGTYTQSPIHTYDSPGSYNVSLTTTGPGGSNTKTVNGDVVVGGGSFTRWLTPYLYRDMITLAGVPDGTIPMYALPVNVHAAAGTNTLTDIYLGGRCNFFPNDMRFTTTDGLTQLPYWIYEIDNVMDGGVQVDTIARIYVAITTPSAGITFFIYYGAISDPGDANDMTSIYIIYDNFSTHRYAHWQTQGPVTIANGVCTIVGPGTGSSNDLYSPYNLVLDFTRTVFRFKYTGHRAYQSPYGTYWPGITCGYGLPYIGDPGVALAIVEESNNIPYQVMEAKSGNNLCIYNYPPDGVVHDNDWAVIQIDRRGPGAIYFRVTPEWGAGAYLEWTENDTNLIDTGGQTFRFGGFYGTMILDYIYVFGYAPNDQPSISHIANMETKPVITVSKSTCYPGESITITVTGVVNPTIYPADGTSTVGNTVTVTYPNAGTFTPVISYTDINGHTQYVIGPDVRVKSVLVPDFTNDTGFFTELPATVQFTDTSTCLPTGWLWDFGDGTTSTQQNPSHTYTKDGIFNVRLTVSNLGGDGTLLKQDLISVNIQKNVNYGGMKP